MTKLPTFLIIGVEKSGTTSIYNYLKQHPQIYMSPVKETNFLERDWDHVDSETRARKKDRIDTFEKYCQLFEQVTDEVAIGEVSPNYLFHHATSIDRIQQYVPDVKLIAILRDPADRAHSDYLMHVRDVIGEAMPLSEQIQHRATSSFTLRKGFYFEPLRHFIDTFGSDRVKVFLYEDLCNKPTETMQSMYRFLGVDETFCPDMSRRSQVAQVPKSQAFNAMLRKQNPFRSAVAALLKALFPYSVRQELRNRLIQFNSQDKDKAPLTPEVRQQLINLYREDILKLQELIQRDLSAWLT